MGKHRRELLDSAITPINELGCIRRFLMLRRVRLLDLKSTFFDRIAQQFQTACWSIASYGIFLPLSAPVACVSSCHFSTFPLVFLLCCSLSLSCVPFSPSPFFSPSLGLAVVVTEFDEHAVVLRKVSAPPKPSCQARLHPG